MLEDRMKLNHMHVLGFILLCGNQMDSVAVLSVSGGEFSTYGLESAYCSVSLSRSTLPHPP